jgi:hypothetical protein
MTPQETPMPSPRTQSAIETIVLLAEEISRAAPECATKAMQIVELARGLDEEPDQATIQDALDSQTLDAGFSDVGSQNAARAVADALKD